MSGDVNNKDNKDNKDNKQMESPSLRYLSFAFISLIFIIIILAVGTQLVFSPEKVTTWVKSSLEETGLRSRLKEARIKIEFKKAQTTLTGSLLHPIGVRLSDLKVSADRGCKHYTTSFNTVVLPFGIFEILKGSFKLGTIKFSQGKTKETEVCQSSKAKGKGKGYSSASTFYDNYFDEDHPEKRLLRFDKRIRNLFQSLQSGDTIFNKVQGILVYDWSYIEESKTTAIELNVERFRVHKLTGGDLILKGEWGGFIAFKKENLDFEGEVVVSNEHISLSSELKYKEGKAFLNHSYEYGRNSAFQVSAENMPISVFLPLFSLEQKFSTSFLRSSWLSLKLKFDVKKDELDGSLSSFGIKTEDGMMDLTSGEARGSWNKSEDRWTLNKPVKFIFSNFRALNLFNLKAQKDFSKVLFNFGKFDLSLRIDEQINIFGAFESTGQSLFIRSGGRLGVQDVLSSLGEFSWAPEKDLKIRLYYLKLEKGEFEGEMGYTLNDRAAKFTADIKELSFNPDLWKEVFKVNTVGRFRIKGQIDVERIKNSDVKETTSQFRVFLNKLDHKLWSLKNAEFDCAFSEFLSCNLRFSKLSSRSKLQDWFKKDDRIELIRNLRNQGELTFKDKSLDLGLFYKRPSTAKLSLSWSMDQGPILTFPNEVALNLEDL